PSAAAAAPSAAPAPVDPPAPSPGYVQPGSSDSLRPKDIASDQGADAAGAVVADDGALPALDVLDLGRQNANAAIGSGTLGVESALGDSGFGLPAFAEVTEESKLLEDEPIDIEAAFGGPPPFSPRVPQPPAPAPPPAKATPLAVPRVAAAPKVTPLATPPAAPLAASSGVGRASRPFVSPVPARPTQGGLRAVEAPAPGRPSSPPGPPSSPVAPLPTLAEARAAAAAGQREQALTMLRVLLARHEENQRLTDVAVVLDEIVRVDADDVAAHHKRVELACRLDDRTRIIGSYLGLAAALQRSGQEKRARAVYQRVLDLDPGREEAQRALAAAAVPEAPAPREPVAVEPATSAGFMDLGAMLRADEPRRSTRMVIEERAPSGDEQADFAEMFRKFKQGIAESVAEEDHESHYDLGVAYKEMGLVDEAIAEFQKALRGTDRRARAYEALGQCFVEKGQFRIASAVLRNALQEPGADDQQLIGVLYLLGQSAEAMQAADEAQTYYQRVFAVDIEFRDAAARLDALAQVTR
ncbi:MAG TPA: tetratricopeptide repeat protein, partial [Gemmatimonadaceae bacterium]|nr:tetratricopeptide repeat protein [Gemmatimonadaceae bacterium]